MLTRKSFKVLSDFNTAKKKPAHFGATSWGLIQKIKEMRGSAEKRLYSFITNIHKHAKNIYI